MIGADYRFWQRDAVYVDYRNTFKPAAIDYGPDFTPSVLAPETADTWETGVKGTMFGGAVDCDFDAFRMNFYNLVVQTTDALGNPLLQNAGSQILLGVEGTVNMRLSTNLTLALNGSYHDAHFVSYTATEGGQNIDAAGKALPLSPRFLGSAGLPYAPPQGLFGSTVLDYVGSRYLDIANQAPIRGYTTLAATIGYRLGPTKFWSAAQI